MIRAAIIVALLAIAGGAAGAELTIDEKEAIFVRHFEAVAKCVDSFPANAAQCEALGRHKAAEAFAAALKAKEQREAAIQFAVETALAIDDARAKRAAK